MNRINLSAANMEFMENSMLAIREGLVTPEMAAKLRELLLADKGARKFWLFTNQMDSQLQTCFEEDRVARTDRTPDPLLRKRPRPVVWLGTLGAAALLALGIFIAQKKGMEPHVPPAAAPIATVISQAGSGILGSRGEPVRTLGLGNYLLSEGLSLIEFENGTQLVLEGPIEFGILGEDFISLTKGKIWVNCPIAAHGFSVITPSEKKIIDLGTEFGVEVRPDGQAEVHVLEGAVRLVDLGKEDLDILAGESVRWSPEISSVVRGETDYAKFKAPPDLDQSRLEDSRISTRKRKDLLVYYDFSGDTGSVVPNAIKGAPSSSNGHILGAHRESGRSLAHTSLRFNGSGDAVSFTIPDYEDLSKFTIAMWVKAERMDSALIALLNSDGWEAGDIHFQVTRNGALRAGRFGDRGYESSDGVVKLGQWHLLAVSWDLEGRDPILFCDGQQLKHWYFDNTSKESRTDTLRSQPGECQIGNWAKPTRGDRRDFSGWIDEVMIFRKTLRVDEIEELYQQGRP